MKDKFKTPHDEYTFHPYAKKAEVKQAFSLVDCISMPLFCLFRSLLAMLLESSMTVFENRSVLCTRWCPAC